MLAIHTATPMPATHTPQIQKIKPSRPKPPITHGQTHRTNSQTFTKTQLPQNHHHYFLRRPSRHKTQTQTHLQNQDSHHKTQIQTHGLLGEDGAGERQPRLEQEEMSTKLTAGAQGCRLAGVVREREMSLRRGVVRERERIKNERK